MKLNTLQVTNPGLTWLIIQILQTNGSHITQLSYQPFSVMAPPRDKPHEYQKIFLCIKPHIVAQQQNKGGHSSFTTLYSPYYVVS
jgi:hypothetical protein